MATFIRMKSIMLLLPAKYYSINCDKSVDQVMSKLHLMIDAEKDENMKVDYIGQIMDNTFVIQEKQSIGLYFNSFIPVLRGSCSDCGEYTLIDIQAELRKPIKIFIVGFYILLFLISFIAVLITEFRDFFVLLPAAGIFSFAVCMMHIGFMIYSKRAVNELENELNN